MKEIRELFHKIGNYHNRICVGIGVCRMELGKDSTVSKETLKRLVEMEGLAVEATNALRKLKDMISGIVDLDTGKPKSK